MPERPSMARLLAVLCGAAIAVAVLAVGVALSAGGAASVTLSRADSLALKALKAKRGTAPLAVFRSRTPLRPGAVIAQAGTPPRPGAARRVGDNVLRRAGVQFSKAPVVMRVGREPSYMYFEDLAPYEAWEHPARIVLVG